MKSPTLEDKIAYYAKVRKANYTDSLRLEGFDVGPKKPQKDDVDPDDWITANVAAYNVNYGPITDIFAMFIGGMIGTAAR